jgi:hypothetical protein
MGDESPSDSAELLSGTKRAISGLMVHFGGNPLRLREQPRMGPEPLIALNERMVAAAR